MVSDNVLPRSRENFLRKLNAHATATWIYLCSAAPHWGKKEEKKKVNIYIIFEVFSEKNKKITIFSCQQHSFIAVAFPIFFFKKKKKNPERVTAQRK